VWLPGLWDALSARGTESTRESAVNLGAPELLMLFVMMLIAAGVVAGVVVLVVFLVKRASK